MNLEQTLKQVGILSPQLIQSIEILQMSTHELEHYLQQLSLENPVMELEAVREPSEKSTEDFGKMLQWLEDNDRQNAFYLRSDADETDFEPLYMAGTDGGLEPDLYTHLKNQLDSHHAKDPARPAAKFIAGCLDDTGYLTCTTQSLAVDAAVSEQSMRDGLTLLQKLDPPGVGATDLSECLVLQLNRLGIRGCALEIASNHLDELSRVRYKLISTKLGVSLEKVTEAAEIIRKLEPRPGEAFKRFAPPSTVVPDIFVTEQQDGKLVVSSNANTMPTLRISSYYKKLYSETAEPEVKEYLDEKMRQVRFAIRSVSQRGSTLVECGRRIVARQEHFFRTGDANLIPMTHADLAEDLEINNSTVSRAVREKYLQCQHGVFPLSFFFSHAVGDVSARSAYALLKDLIDAEDKARPLSDQKLSEKLVESGCRISRRTVAKYRSELNIPDTTRRRQ